MKDQVHDAKQYCLAVRDALAEKIRGLNSLAEGLAETEPLDVSGLCEVAVLAGQLDAALAVLTAAIQEPVSQNAPGAGDDKPPAPDANGIIRLGGR